MYLEFDRSKGMHINKGLEQRSVFLNSLRGEIKMMLIGCLLQPHLLTCFTVTHLVLTGTHGLCPHFTHEIIELKHR